MEYYGLNQLREMFLDYFATKNGHLRLNSFSLIPQNDKSLLIINSGMAPLKPYFTRQETPPRKRVTTCQKCIRTPDIENVGKTARHGTFFEMLGNFSFGDYFKTEAIQWAWEFLTEVVHIPKELLYATVYLDDDEAYAIWRDVIGLPESHISRMGKEDNFWEIGTGPCGPCSEIYVDRGEKYGCGKDDCKVGCECDRFVEVWNLVFTQFDRKEDGAYDRLEHPNIDTGMGLERLAMAVQEVANIFEVDTIKYVRDYICKLSRVEYGLNETADISVRVITDHIRSTVFMLSDGIIPSNEGRGYVLRRLLRRAVRHGKLLGIEGMFMEAVAEKVIECSHEAYEELSENKDMILKMIHVEEAHFNEKIARGEQLLKELIEENAKRGIGVIGGEDAFKLYDTFGFPLELTMEIAEENSVTVDTAGFETAMKNQKAASKKAHELQGIAGWKDELTEIVSGMKATRFTGYDCLEQTSKVVCIVADSQSVDGVSSPCECVIITEATPFYGQMGGQAGDMGILTGEGLFGEVTDTLKSGDKTAHYVRLTEGSVSLGQTVDLKVDQAHRMNIQRNHTATHLLHKTLKIVLGSHVNQAGSEVNADKLRFDFSHFEKLTDEQLEQVEKLVNEEILKCLPVEIFTTTLSEAKKAGATALFGEKYSDEVRVVKAGEFSMELCGGCHLSNTGFAGMFKIISEGAVAAGIRRIEALTGKAAYEYACRLKEQLDEAAEAVKASPAALTQRINELLSANNAYQKEIKALKDSANKDLSGEILSGAFEEKGIKYALYDMGESDVATLRDMSDKLREKMDCGVVLLTGFSGAKGVMLCAATKSAVQAGFNCGAFIKEISQALGGSGGGRPDMAQAGFKDPARAKEVLEIALKLINN